MAFTTSPIYAIPTNRSIGWSDAYFTRLGAMNIQAPRMLFASGTATSSSPVVSITQTWNSGGTSFIGATTNITDTASASTSRLHEWQVGGSAMFGVRKDGAAAWQNDTFLLRDAANHLALRNSTTSQSFSIYNTYTDASTYERANLSWSGGIFNVSTSITGGTRASLKLSGNTIQFYSNNSDIIRWQIDTGGAFVPSAAYDVGSTTFPINRVYTNKISGQVSAAGNPTTTHFTTNKDWGMYKNTTSGHVVLAYNDSGAIRIFNRSPLVDQGSGVWLFEDSSFARLTFGGTTSSFPSLKRSGALLLAQLADDSALASFAAGAIVGTSITSTTSVSAGPVLLNSSGAIRIAGTAGDGYLAFTATGSSNGTMDTFLLRDAANIFAQRNSTAAQGYHLYNTYTSGSNYERAELKWVSNVLRLHNTTTGGTVRGISLGGSSIDLQTGTTLQSRYSINSSGHIIPQAHESYDLGSSSANMRQVFSAKFGGVIAAAGDPTTGTYTTNEDWGFYKNTSGTNDIRIVYNDNGTLVEFEPGTGGSGTSPLVDQGGGVWLFDDSSYARLNLGDNTDESPSIKKSTTDVHFVLADNSDYTNIRCSTVGLVTDGLTSESPYIYLAGYSGPVELLNLDLLRVYNVGANSAGVEVIKDGTDLTNYAAGGVRWNGTVCEFNTWAAGTEDRLAPNYGLFHRDGQEDGTNLRTDTFGVFLDTDDDSVSLFINDSVNAVNSVVIPLTKLSSPYIVTNVTTNRAYNANSTSINELADILGTLIADLQAVRIIP